MFSGLSISSIHVDSFEHTSVYFLNGHSSLKCLAPKRGKRDKLREVQKGHQPFKFPGNHLASEAEACNNRGYATAKATHLFAPLWSEATISNQSTDHRYLEERVLIDHFGSCKLCASYYWNTWTAGCLRAGEWRADCYCTKSWNFLKLITLSLSLPPRLQVLSRLQKFQNRYIRQTLPEQWLSRLRDRFMVLPTLPSLESSGALPFVMCSHLLFSFIVFTRVRIVIWWELKCCGPWSFLGYI